MGLREVGHVGGVLGSLDPNMTLEGAKEGDMAVVSLKVGALCTARVPVDRPRIGEVLHMPGELRGLCSPLVVV